MTDEKENKALEGSETVSTSEETATPAAGETPDEVKEAEQEEEQEEEVDDASPEAVARRVAALGEEDEGERLAREEEEKLAARRNKRGGKRSDLDKAASKRLAKIGTKPKRSGEVAEAVDVPDAAVLRGIRAEQWAKKNQKAVWGVFAGLVVLGLAFGAYTYWDRQKSVAASTALTEAVQDEGGRIGNVDQEDDNDHPKDPRPIFKTAAERREAALAKYREVTAKYPSTGAATLARLGEAAVLLDNQDADGAIRAFTDASQSPLAKADAEVTGRALEGLGFAYELKAAAAPAGPEKDGFLDQAIQQFRALENTDVTGFKELGMYHQARCFEAKGDKAKAIETLKSLHERLNKPGETHPLPYVQELTDDRLRRLDPTAVPPKSPSSLGGPGGNSMNDAQMKKLMEQIKQGQHK